MGVIDTELHNRLNRKLVSLEDGVSLRLRISGGPRPHIAESSTESRLDK